jgi:hypothetical protein
VVKLLHFASSSHLSTRPQDRRHLHPRTRRPRPARRAAGLRQGEHPKPGVTCRAGAPGEVIAPRSPPGAGQASRRWALANRSGNSMF